MADDTFPAAGETGLYMDIFWGVYIALMGLAAGSFLNVLIYRMPMNISPLRGRSACPACGHALSFGDLLPVASFFALRGRCRYCGGRISPRYPAVELLNAFLWVMLYIVYGLSLPALLYAAVCSTLVVLAGIDYDHKLIFDRFHVIIGAAGLLFLIFVRELPWHSRVIGFFAVSVPLFVIAVLTGGVGEGDIKLFAVCGLLLGWQRVLLAFVLSAVLAAAFGVVLMMRGKAERKSEIPFGPFISAACILSILAGDAMINAYLSLLL